MKLKLPKTSPRRLLYLLALTAISLIFLSLSNIRLTYYKASGQAHKAYLSTHLKEDTERARYLFYANYRPDTDYIASQNNYQRVTFISVCQEQCILLNRTDDILHICNKLDRSYKFDQYRVYNCSIIATVENDKPFNCKVMDHEDLKTWCRLLIASL